MTHRDHEHAPLAPLDAGQAPGASALPRPRGRPASGLGPEYQEVIRLASEGAAPRDIAIALGRSPGWARSALAYLRSVGAVDARARAGRPRSRAAPAPRPVRVSLALPPDLAAAIERARGDIDATDWILATLRDAAGR